jgi:type VI secretion system protein ImpJ
MQPVLWTKGVLLSPQHLQTQDRFLEDRLHFHLSGLTLAPWGFRTLRLDHEALAGGSVAIAEASGIFPDGLLFDMPEADALPQPRSLAGSWEQDQTELDVYLAVPEYQRGGRNVSANGGDESTRYGAEVLMRRDENTGLSEKPIQVARKNFRLLVDGDAMEGHSLLRIARVQRTATGALVFDPHFVPPLIDISASGATIAILRRLVEILSARSSALSGTRRQRNLGLADFSIADVASFWLLYSINSAFPELRDLLERQRGHPAALFSAMLSLAGTLTTFSTKLRPQDLPVYEHDDLTGCFARLDEQLRDLLDTVVPAACVSIPLRLAQQSIYAAALDDDRYLSAPELYLAVAAGGARPAGTSGASTAELIQRAPQKIKLSSADRIDHLIRQALPGLGLVHTPSPPSAVPIKVGHHYFQLSRSGPEWDAVVNARNLAAYVPADFPTPELELIVVLPRTR